MPFAASLSHHPVPAEAAGEVLGELLDKIGPEPDLAVVFATTPLTGALEDIAATVRAVLRPRTLLGTTAVSLIGGGEEVEEASALTVWAGSTGAVRPVRLEADPLEEGFTVRGLDRLPEAGTLILMADPFSFPVDGVLARLAQERPGLTVVGGLASAARGPGGNRLVLDGALHHDGAVGVVVGPDRPVRTVVSQGCRPVGEPMIVTRAERSMIYELAGRPAMERVTELAESSSPAELALLHGGIHLGVVVDEAKAEFDRGDFLVRNVLGADRDNGAVAIGGTVEVGTTVQFQVRDADTADEDLRVLLGAGGPAQGALVFTCTGRGIRLFGEAHHDAQVVAAVTDGACAGMFCAGELGPIGGRNALHGFTASIALFD